MAQSHSVDLELGSSQYLSVADAAIFDINGAMTLEAWIKLESQPATNALMAIISKWQASGNQRTFSLAYRDVGGTKNLVFLSTTDGASSTGISVNITLELGVWYHIAFSCNGNNSPRNGSLYVNGRAVVNDDTFTVASGFFNSTAPVTIGCIMNGASPENLFDGLIKDARIFNDRRTQAEIAADAHSETVVDANLVAEWNFNNSYADSSGNGKTLTAVNSPVFGVDIPWEAPTSVSSSEQCVDLEKSNSQSASISDGTQTGLDIAGDLTLEAWAMMESYPAANNFNIIAGKEDFSAGGNRAYVMGIEETTGTSTYRLGVRINGNSYNVSNPFTLRPGVWYHFAITRSSATGVITFYVNGVAIGTAAGVTGALNNSPAPFAIGARYNGAAAVDHWDGLIRQVRVFNSIRTQAEIVADARTASVASANLKGEWALNNSYADTSGNNNTLTAANAPVFKPWSYKIAGALVSYWSMDELSGNRADSHGTNNLTDVNTVASAAGKKSNAADFEASNNETLDGANHNMTSSWSVSAWVNPESFTVESRVLSVGDNGLEDYFVGMNTNGYAGMGYAAQAAAFEAVNAIALATWSHVVWVHDDHGNEDIIYINGKETRRWTGRNSNPAAGTGGEKLRIGGHPNSANIYNMYDGLMDEVALYSRALDYGEVLDLYKEGAAIGYSVPASVQNSGFLMFM